MATSRSSRHPHLHLVTLLLAAVTVAVPAYIPPADAARSAARAGIAGGFLRAARGAIVSAQSLSFEPNRGQAVPGVGFLAHGQGYTIALAATGAALTVSQPAGQTRTGATPQAQHIALQMDLIGGNPAAHGQGQQQLPGTVGYGGFGQTRSELADIPTYAAVRYGAVYPGVDIVYYGRGQQLEYDLRLAPGADPLRIRLGFRGAGHPSVAPTGELLLPTADGVVHQHAPVIYQLIRGSRKSVSGSYALMGNTVGFRVGAYDRRLPLVIDPVLAYSTYFGNKGDDSGNGVAVDSQGNAYVVGTTMGSSSKLAFVSKFDSTGRHVLYTRFVSNIYTDARTACDSTGTGVAVDGQGNAYITGMYGYEDEFNLCTNEAVLWARVDPTGHLNVKIFGKYGGNKGSALAVDGQGNTYLTGSTDQWELNFPVTQGAFQTKPGIDRTAEGLAGDAFVLKIDPSGQEVYGTFLGGSVIDDGNGIAVDRQGQVYVVGSTASNNFPVTADAFQRQKHNAFANGFVSKLSADGSTLLYSTYLSGNNGEDLKGVALDGQGNVYVVGSSDSYDFPTTPSAYKRTCGGDGMCDPLKIWTTDYSTNTNLWHISVAEDVVVAVLDTTQAGAASLRYSTFIGSKGRDLGLAIAVDQEGRAYVTGRSASPGYPGAQGTTGPTYDALLSVIDPRQSGAGSLVFSATFGGSGDDAGQGIAVDRRGNVYVTGYTNGRDFPTHGALQAANAGGYDAFVLKISGFPAGH